MAGEESDNAFVSFYRSRIGEPTNDDEVYGYWVFVVGVVLGLAGIVLFMTGDPASEPRRWGTVFGAAGLLFLVAGPLYRLPLSVMATRLIYLGGVLSLTAIAWFMMAFPGQWTPNRFTGTTGNIVLLYTSGLAVIALGGIVAPLVAGRSATGERASLRDRIAEKDERIDELREDVERLDGSEAAGEAADERVAELEAELNELSAELDEREGELAALRESNARFELYEDAAGEHRWRLRHRNGNIVATGGEGYTRRHNAQKGLRSVKRNAVGAAVVRAEEIESAADEAGEPIAAAPKQAPPEPPEPGEIELHVEPDSQATFEVYEDEGGEHRWRLVHDNGNVLADSGEGYTPRADAREAVDRIREYAGPADYLAVDPTAFEVYQDRGGEWRWRLIHRNGNVLADSGEGYARRWNTRRAVEGVRDAVAGESDAAFETYEDAAGEHRWRLRHANGNVLADSGEGYSDATAVDDAVERVEAYVPEADTLDVGRAAFEIYEDAAGKWRWRLRHRNGNVLADSGQGYGSRSRTEDAVDSVKRNAPGADREE